MRSLTMYNIRTAHRGFTIVELAIVIVVIAILAALAYVGYNGISVRAAEASLHADLTSAAKQLEVDYSFARSYPSNLNAADDGAGIKPSDGNILHYSSTRSTYCVTAQSIRQGARTFIVSHDNTTPREGVCPEHVAAVESNNPSSSGPAEVTTLVGDGTAGTTNGTGTAARVHNPYGIVVDDAGILYTTDVAGNTVRRITPEGVTSTIAGGSRGPADGQGSAAQFNSPTGIVRTSDGTLYVSDRNNNKIRKISPSGNVTTFAGTGVAGYADGPAATAQFYLGTDANDLALDSQENLYVSDRQNQRIRKITPDGTVSTIATPASGLIYPTGLTIVPNGDLYVVNRMYNRIDKVSQSGTVTRFVGGGTTGSRSGYEDGTGTNALFNSPSGITSDNSGNLYVADYFNHRIRKVTSAGRVTTVAGSGVEGHADGLGEAAQFYRPYGIGIDTQRNILYVADWGNQRIRKIAL